MTDLTTTRYKNVSEFLKETETNLQKHELENTFVLITVHQMLKEENEGKNPSYYAGAVWSNKHEFIFAIFAQDNGSLFASFLAEKTQPQAVGLLVQDLLQTSIDIKGLHGYQPVLNMVLESIETHSKMTFVKQFATLSFELKQVEWSPRSKEVAESEFSSLRLASASDFDLLQKWALGFIQDAFDNRKAVAQPVASIANDMIASKGLYILCMDGSPVSMAWKLRPLKHGTSLAYVYTPAEHRGKGYGAACVAMTSEAILKDYSYVTLFVDIKRDPNDNLYTRVGYRYIGEAGRLERLS